MFLFSLSANFNMFVSLILMYGRKNLKWLKRFNFEIYLWLRWRELRQIWVWSLAFFILLNNIAYFDIFSRFMFLTSCSSINLLLNLAMKHSSTSFKFISHRGRLVYLVHPRMILKSGLAEGCWSSMMVHFFFFR